jgi:hypothetical protein
MYAYQILTLVNQLDHAVKMVQKETSDTLREEKSIRLLWWVQTTIMQIDHVYTEP